MYDYHGYWFWDLQKDKIIQAKDVTDEYCLLHLPQCHEGPFVSQGAAEEFKKFNPHLSREFLRNMAEMEEFLNDLLH